MAGIRRKPKGKSKRALYQGWFIDHTGKRRFFTGTASRSETLRIAHDAEAEHRKIRLGYLPTPEPVERYEDYPFVDILSEYLAWGEAQGGRGGRPWGREHTRKRRERLNWWQNRLTLEHLSNLDGSLARVEAALRELQAGGRAGKTVSNYAEALGAFCDWCVERDYFVSDPLKKLRGFDTTPQTQRRAITADEVRRLLAVCPNYWRLLWETALLSGLRANELRHLSVDHLDVERGGLHLDASWTKNRRDDFLPLPHSFVHRLHTFAATGEAIRKYQQAYFGKEIPSRVPASPLLYVPRDPARELDKDLKAAAIPKYTREGKVDFHALRLAYINFVLASGASVKEAQALARHATPAMTMNVYGRTRNERLVQTVERVGEMISAEENCAGNVPEPSDRIAEHEGNAQVFQEDEAGKVFMPKGGFESDRMLPIIRRPYGQAPDISGQVMRKANRLTSALSLIFP